MMNTVYSDDELMTMLEARDETAISGLDSKYGRLCAFVAKNILGSDEDAEECKYDALMKVWSTIPPAKPDSLKSYAAMAARGLAINRYNQQMAQKRIKPCALDELEAALTADGSTIGGDVSNEIEAKELGGAINDFLALCKRDERNIFVRRYIYCESPEAIAVRLGIRVGSLNVKLYRLRARLQAYLKERNFI